MSKGRNVLTPKSTKFLRKKSASTDVASSTSSDPLESNARGNRANSYPIVALDDCNSAVSSPLDRHFSEEIKGSNNSIKSDSITTFDQQHPPQASKGIVNSSVPKDSSCRKPPRGGAKQKRKSSLPLLNNCTIIWTNMDSAVAAPNVPNVAMTPGGGQAGAGANQGDFQQPGVNATALGIPPASAQARLRQAKKDRMKQLKEYHRREKEEALKLKKISGRKGAPTSAGRTPKIRFVSSIVLLEAAARNDLEEVQRLLDEGIDPNSCNEDGLTALHQCCIDHYPQMMKLLVDGGADVNATDSELWTPLHAAATCNHLDLVQYLIANGADLLAVNSDGNMPYDICEETQPSDRTLDFIESAMASRGITQQMIDDKRAQPQMQMLRDLQVSVKQGFDVNLPREGDLATALHIASANCYVDVVAFLLENVGVDVHVKDKDGWQPIHAACCWCHEQIALMLIDAGASLETVTNNFETALDLCDDPDFKLQLIQRQQEVSERRAAEAERQKRHLNTDVPAHASFDGNFFKQRSSGQRDSFMNNDNFKRHDSRRGIRSSVRRSSMREKKDLQKKDMKEEFNTVASVDGENAGNSSTSLSSIQQQPPPDLQSLQMASFDSISSHDEQLPQKQQQQNYVLSKQTQQHSYSTTQSNDFLPPSSQSSAQKQPPPYYSQEARPHFQGAPNSSGDMYSTSSRVLMPPQEFQNSPNSDPYSQQHITNGSSRAPASVNNQTQSSVPPHNGFNSNSSPSQRSAAAHTQPESHHSHPGGAVTLQELKHERAQKRHQQMVLTGASASKPDPRNQHQHRVSGSEQTNSVHEDGYSNRMHPQASQKVLANNQPSATGLTSSLDGGYARASQQLNFSESALHSSSNKKAYSSSMHAASELHGGSQEVISADKSKKKNKSCKVM